MKAIVIGGGIGGMCAALALEKSGYQTEVYEAVSVIKPVGAAISIWPNGVKCLNYLGLGEQLRALGGNMAMMAYHDFRRARCLPASACSRWWKASANGPVRWRAPTCRRCC